MMMKRPVHPLLSILFLFATTAAFWFCANYVSGAGVYTFFTSEVGETQPLSPVNNVSLLMFSAVDLADDLLRQNVQQLKEVQRSFLSYVGARSALGGPMKLMSPEFFKIWLDFQRNLQDWWSHLRFEPGVMSNLVNITSKISGNSKSFKYKTCAVVGNSGILLNSNQGVKIDSHEFVIRLNNARTHSYERFVGSKTSLSFMNSNILHFCSRRQSCYCHPYGRKVPIMTYISQPVHFLDYVVCNSSHKAPLTITDPKLDVLCARIVKYYSVKRFLKETGKPLEEWNGGVEFHYSSGMQAVMFALGVCDKVSLFGFGKSDSAKHHYHTNQKSELGLHDYLAEYDLYHDLANSPEVVPFVSDTFKFPPVTIHA